MWFLCLSQDFMYATLLLPGCRDGCFKNACVCQVETSKLRAVRCLPVLTQAICGLLSVSMLLFSAGLQRTVRRAAWHVHKLVRRRDVFPTEALQSELLSELEAEETGLTGAEMSVDIR